MAKKKRKFHFNSEEVKQAWIAEAIEKKNAERKKQFEKSGVQFVTCLCDSCYHEISKSCPGLPQEGMVCRYWYSPDSPVIGVAYCGESLGAEKKRKGEKLTPNG